MIRSFGTNGRMAIMIYTRLRDVPKLYPLLVGGMAELCFGWSIFSLGIVLKDPALAFGGATMVRHGYESVDFLDRIGWDPSTLSASMYTH